MLSAALCLAYGAV